MRIIYGIREVTTEIKSLILVSSAVRLLVNRFKLCVDLRIRRLDCNHGDDHRPQGEKVIGIVYTENTR